MDKADFNKWLAQALGERGDVAVAAYNPAHPEEGVRVTLSTGYQAAVSEREADVDVDDALGDCEACGEPVRLYGPHGYAIGAVTHMLCPRDHEDPGENEDVEEGDYIEYMDEGEDDPQEDEDA